MRVERIRSKSFEDLYSMDEWVSEMCKECNVIDVKICKDMRANFYFTATLIIG